MLVARTRYAFVISIIFSPANMSCQTITDAKNAQAAADQKAGTTSINAGNAGVGFFNTANVDSLLGEIVTASLAVTATGADATATAAAGASSAERHPSARRSRACYQLAALANQVAILAAGFAHHRWPAVWDEKRLCVAQR